MTRGAFCFSFFLFHLFIFFYDRTYVFLAVTERTTRVYVAPATTVKTSINCTCWALTSYRGRDARPRRHVVISFCREEVFLSLLFFLPGKSTDVKSFYNNDRSEYVAAASVVCYCTPLIGKVTKMKKKKKCKAFSNYTDLQTHESKIMFVVVILMGVVIIVACFQYLSDWRDWRFYNS